MLSVFRIGFSREPVPTFSWQTPGEKYASPYGLVKNLICRKDRSDKADGLLLRPFLPSECFLTNRTS
ncbi:hypothetical protein H4S14_003369 [Agrobacterium vitis]|nr:hypothetical protein [Agrobacterium vitis]MBE1439604.1 hypothetical protein [Agrobacterium vitis]